MSEHRLMLLYIPYHLMIAFMTGKYQLNNLDLPSDAKVVQVDREPDRKAFCLYVESASFNAIPEGTLIPALPPVRIQVVDDTTT